MNRKGLFILLFLIIHTSLSAQKETPVVDVQDTVADTIKAQQLKSDTTVVTAKMTASTLLDEYRNVVDTTVTKLPKTYAWRIDPRYGDRILTSMDTVRENFHRRSLVEGQGVAMSYLGNVGGPVQTMEFFERKDASQFPFMDVYEVWRRTPEKQLFMNTKVPYSNLYYQAGGGKEVAENHFKAEVSSNFGKRLNAGFNFDYIYTRGYYKALYNKQVSYDFNASYIGERYKMHFFAGNNNLKASDNGGLEDERYITNPEADGISNFRGGSKDIPVIFEDGIRNHLRGRHFFVTNSYDLGNNLEYVQLNDSVGGWRKKDNYIAPASIILTTHYQDQRRTVFEGGNASEYLKIFDYTYVPNIKDEDGNLKTIYTDPLRDYMSHYTFSNTLAFRMNEGFKPWVKFGLTAFVEYEMRRFLMPGTLNQHSNIKDSDDVMYFGGKLNKNQSKYLKFEASLLKGINTNDFEIEGNVYSQLPIFNKEVGVKAKAYIKNRKPSYFQNHFTSRNWVFENDFKDTKRVFLGGEIELPKFSFSETTISGGYENITDYIYVGEKKIVETLDSKLYDSYRREYMQVSDNINVISLKLSQRFKAGIFHFDFDALLQKTDRKDVIPLPLWAVYGNVYLETLVSKVLTLQLGADVSMYQEYEAPGYDVLLNQFYTQRPDGLKIGGFPNTNLYVNLHLKYTRIFVMAYNVTSGMGNRKYFGAPRYPTNPFMIRWGLSWQFNN